jgi:hypothetical protein
MAIHPTPAAVIWSPDQTSATLIGMRGADPSADIPAASYGLALGMLASV